MSLFLFCQAMPSTSGIGAVPAGVDAEVTTPPAPAGPDYRNHRFYRLPVAEPASHVEPFDGIRAMDVPSTTWVISEILAPIHKLLTKTHLCPEEVTILMYWASELVTFATVALPKPTTSAPPSEWVVPLARQFLVADTLWGICEVVGEAMNKETWWTEFMTRLLSSSQFVSTGVQRSNSRLPLVRRLIAALEIYRKGERPDAEEVVHLKREIFCRSSVHKQFRRACWDAWRQDDWDFQGN